MQHLSHLIASLSALYGAMPGSAEGHSGVIVALPVPPLMAARIVHPGGTPVEEMHVTLAYLGKVDDYQDPAGFLRLASSLHDLAEHTPALQAHFGGPGTFLASDDGKDACYLSVDAPHLPELRQRVVEAVRAAGLRVDMTHGFVPHVTLAYQDSGAPHPRSTPVEGHFTFEAVGLWIGGYRLSLPLARTPRSVLQAIVTSNMLPMVKGDAPSDGRAQAQALLAQLGGDLATVDAQDAALSRIGDQLRVHHQQAFEGMAQAIPAPRGSALEDAALFHAGEAGGARRAG